MIHSAQRSRALQRLRQSHQCQVNGESVWRLRVTRNSCTPPLPYDAELLVDVAKQAPEAGKMYALDINGQLWLVQCVTLTDGGVAYRQAFSRDPEPIFYALLAGAHVIGRIFSLSWDMG